MYTLAIPCYNHEMLIPHIHNAGWGDGHTALISESNYLNCLHTSIKISIYRQLITVNISWHSHFVWLWYMWHITGAQLSIENSRIFSLCYIFALTGYRIHHWFHKQDDGKYGGIYPEGKRDKIEKIIYPTRCLQSRKIYVGKKSHKFTFLVTPEVCGY
jgi:hypothetical protein